MIRRIIACSWAAGAALALAACSSGSDDTPQTADAAGLDIPDVEVPEISLETIREGTRTLSSDEFEGRMPGTVGEEKTLAWLVEKFEAAGLEPGNDGSWFQDVPLVEITGSNFAPLTVDAGGETMEFAYQDDWVGVSYRETPRTRIEDSELVFVGYGAEEDGATVLELTYNWDQEKPYEIGTAFGHLAIGVPDIYATCDALRAEGACPLSEVQISAIHRHHDALLGQLVADATRGNRQQQGLSRFLDKISNRVCQVVAGNNFGSGGLSGKTKLLQ